MGILTLTKGSGGNSRPLGYGNVSGILILGLPRDGQRQRDSFDVSAPKTLRTFADAYIF